MKTRLSGLLAGLLCVLEPVVSAQLLDDIEVRTERGVAEMRLQFSAPVRYIKHFPADQGELLKIYLQVLQLDPSEERAAHEYKHAQTVSPVPPFRVIYTTARNCFAVPDPLCLDIQFSAPVTYRVRQGEDGRSIILTLLPTAETEKPKPPAVSR
ncbi:MAG: hypothetical protein AMJ72_08070 [Acidithiobacillales bacterium SM1_46]|nr:MAG: hypothetical protein AMJ72_08070 [Acidithiobacillales bacterium SM1_46]